MTTKTANPAQDGLRITALAPADAARVLSAASGRRVTEEQVREVADRGGLLRADGTLSLLEYTAYLVEEMAGGSD